MNKPEQREGESDLAFMYRMACWLGGPAVYAMAQNRLKLSEDGKTFIIQRPEYRRKVSAD